MALYTIPVSIVIDAATPAAATQQAMAAAKLLNEPFTKTLIAGQGLQIKSAKVGVPVAGTT